MQESTPGCDTNFLTSCNIHNLQETDFLTICNIICKNTLQMASNRMQQTEFPRFFSNTRKTSRVCLHEWQLPHARGWQRCNTYQIAYGVVLEGLLGGSRRVGRVCCRGAHHAVARVIRESIRGAQHRVRRSESVQRLHRGASYACTVYVLCI